MNDNIQILHVHIYIYYFYLFIYLLVVLKAHVYGNNISNVLVLVFFFSPLK